LLRRLPEGEAWELEDAFWNIRFWTDIEARSGCWSSKWVQSKRSFECYSCSIKNAIAVQVCFSYSSCDISQKYHTR
jgi:hypothetical protein